MLRFFVLALLLLNGIYFGWSQGLLAELGFAPAQQSEPQRLTQQIKPDAVRILSPQELRLIDASAKVSAKPTECLQAGLFDEAQGAQLRQTLASTFPAGSWLLEDAIEPARWIVYMGRYASSAVLEKKRSELSTMKLNFEPLNNPALQFGLSLGGFETQAGANAELQTLNRRGVRTARVVAERPEVRGARLRLPEVDDTLRARLDELKPVLAGKPLQPCQ